MFISKSPTDTVGDLCIYTLCFFMPKIIRKIPLKILGLFTKTTFIKQPPLMFATGYSKNYNPNC